MPDFRDAQRTQRTLDDLRADLEKRGEVKLIRVVGKVVERSVGREGKVERLSPPAW
jgi:hypothetical protein